MKLVRTANGLKTIDDWDMNYVPVKLRDILQDHMETIVNNLLKGKGIETYTLVKFCVKPTADQVRAIQEQLVILKYSPLNIDHYPSILEDVLRNDNVSIGTDEFFTRIEAIIREQISQEPEDRKPWERPDSFSDKNFREMIRHQLVSEIQTEEGLKKYVIENYSSELANRPKLKYLMEEVRDHFKNESKGYAWLHKMFKEKKLGSAGSGNQIIFDAEMNKLLANHFSK
jgi:hypothetical protein